MALDYHLRLFVIVFFIVLGVAVLFAIPLLIVMLIHLIKKGGFKATGALSVIVSLLTSIAVLAFSFALLVLSMFGWIPWWASGILITAFCILVIVALRPWKKAQRGVMLYIMIGLLVLIIALGWIGSWLAHDVCIMSQPDEYLFYIDRRVAGDECAKSGNAPCHTYLTFNTNASTDAIVHFHSTKLYKNPRVFYGEVGNGTYSHVAFASSHKIDIEVKRYIYYGFLRSLTPDTTYYFTVGDGDSPVGDTFIAEKKFRTAPVSGDVEFITGGDIGGHPASLTLMQNAAGKEPLYMAIGGDLAYANGIRSCYQRWDKFLTNLEKAAVTPTGYTVPFIMAPGNHEAGGWAQPAKNMRFYNRYFLHEDLKGRAARELPLHHVHYISNQVIIALDSHVIETPESQVQWLTETLQNAPNGSVKMVMYHAPGYPSYRPMTNTESTAVRKHFVPVFEAHGVTVGFENHDHAYKRTKRLIGGQEHPNGIVYVGDGAMGVNTRAAVPHGRDYLNVSHSKQHYILAKTDAASGALVMNMYDLDDTIFDNYDMPYR